MKNYILTKQGHTQYFSKILKSCECNCEHSQRVTLYTKKVREMIKVAGKTPELIPLTYLAYRIV